jgi:hypothetical protein
MQFHRLAVLALGIAAGLVSGAWASSDAAADLRLPANVGATMQGIDAERIRAHVRFLSDDLLEGRGTGARGGDIAAKYIAAQFALDGLKPAGDDGGYLQKIEFTGVQTLPATTFSLRPEHGNALDLQLGEDYVTNNQWQTDSVDIDAPIVFVGYGIEAPEYPLERFQGRGRQGQSPAGDRQRAAVEGSKIFQRGSPDVLRTLDLQVRRGGAQGCGRRSDHSPHRSRELRLGRGAQFLERRAGVPEP